jgi:hypothetical protein
MTMSAVVLCDGMRVWRQFQDEFVVRCEVPSVRHDLD